MPYTSPPTLEGAILGVLRDMVTTLKNIEATLLEVRAAMPRPARAPAADPGPGLPLDILGLPYRARLRLETLGISTVEGLVRYSAEDLLNIKGFGVVTLNEVRYQLTNAGLRLRDDD